MIFHDYTRKLSTKPQWQVHTRDVKRQPSSPAVRLKHLSKDKDTTNYKEDAMTIVLRTLMKSDTRRWCNRSPGGQNAREWCRDYTIDIYI